MANNHPSVEDEHSHHHMRNTRVLQLPQNMQICFDEDDDEYVHEEERSDIIEENEEEGKEVIDDEDEDVDRLFVDTDEKLNTTAADEYF